MKRKVFQVGVHCLMILLVIFCLLPVLLLFSSSLTGEEDLIRNGYSFIPGTLDFSAYKYILVDSPKLLSGYGISDTLLKEPSQVPSFSHSLTDPMPAL